MPKEQHNQKRGGREGVSEEEIEREWNEFINRQRSQQFLREKNIILRRIKISLTKMKDIH